MYDSVTCMDASTRSSGFCTQSSQRFSFDPVLEFALEFPLLPYEAATLPRGPEIYK